jgi:ferredoxin-NADP reductase/nitrite reductase/ring-hydroxylating ferredoxin subunit
MAAATAPKPSDQSMPVPGPEKVRRWGREEVALLRDGTTPCAVGARCTHEGGPLAEGETRDGAVVCPWHQSQFELQTGRVLEGPAEYAIPAYALSAKGDIVGQKGEGQSGASATYVLRLREARTIAPKTMAFVFEKPEGFAYRAGQYGDWVVTNDENREDGGEFHHFTLASAPHEDFVMIATRMRDSNYKETLRGMAEGDEIEVVAPQGEFTLRDLPDGESGPVVFLTGGIGVTPFRSILLDAIERGEEREMWTFFSNDERGNAPFLDEIASAIHGHPNLHLVTTYTKEHVPSAEHGRIDAPMLRRHCGELRGAVFMIAGPPGMVKGLADLLKAEGVDEDRIVTEDFDGY